MAFGLGLAGPAWAGYITLAQAYATFLAYATLPPKQRYAKVRSEAEKRSRWMRTPPRRTACWVSHWQEAAREFHRAVALATGDPNPHAGLGRYLATQGDFDAAQSDMEKAQRAAPNPTAFSTYAAEIRYYAQAGPHNFLGKALRAQERAPEAVVAFQKEEEISHRDAGVLMDLASSYLAAGKEKDAQLLADEVKGRVEAMLWLQRAYDDQSAW